MRSLLLAVAVALLAAAPAAADYRRLPGPKVDWFTLGGGRLFVAANGSLTAYAPDGTPARIGVPKGGKPGYVTASEKGLSVATDASHSYYRAFDGPWRRAPGPYATVRVSGSRVTSLYSDREDKGGAIRIINLRTGKSRRYKIVGERPVGGEVVGRYFAYAINWATPRETVVVRSVASGREVYRVAPGHLENYELLANGRLVVVTLGKLDGYSRINVATPAHPRLRLIRELGLGSPHMGFSERGIALVHGDPGARSDVAVMDFKGRLTSLTPLVQTVEHVVYDGTTVAFEVGDCVFTGPAAMAPVVTDGCVRSTDGGTGG